MDIKNKIKGLLVLQLFFLSVVFQPALAAVLARSILSASDILVLQEKHNRSTEGVFHDLYSGLFALNTNGEVEPELALQWAVSAEGLSWTFKIRDDSLTLLKIDLAEPVSDLLLHLSRLEAMPLPEHAYDMYGPDMGQGGKIINNGPYLPDNLFNRARAEMVLKKNPKYFKKSNIKFDKIHVIVENDQNKLLKMFQVGKLDIVEGSDPRQKKWLEKYRPEIRGDSVSQALFASTMYTDVPNQKQQE